MYPFKISKLKKALESAVNTDYYSQLFYLNGININAISTYEDFKSIPITTKEIYRDRVWDMVSNDIIKQVDVDYLKEHETEFAVLDDYLKEFGLNLTITSGSTGTPLSVIHSKRDDYRNYFILNRFRMEHVGFSPLQPYLWVLPMNNKTRSYFYNDNVTYLTDGDIGLHYFLAEFSDDKIAKMHEKVQQQQIKWVTGSPTAMTEYARFIQNNALYQKFTYIELHSEPFQVRQLQIIQNVFGCRPVSVYSSNEVNFIAATCEFENYHILEDNVFVEFLDSNIPGIPSKRIILTSLNSFDCPIIRYEIGDMGVLADTLCQCGKPIFKLSGYRDSDFIYLGTRIFEPYIIYDSVYFLEKEFGIMVQYYQVCQIQPYTFLYSFDIQVKQKVENQKIVDFLIKFLYESFELQVNVQINYLEEIGLQKAKAEQKYKRFVSFNKK